MMINPVQTVHAYLRQEYAAHLSLTLQIRDHLGESADVDAVWQWQDADLRRANSEDEACGGVVLDAEIGTCLYIQTFSKESDVKAQLARALRIRSELLPSRDTTARQIDPIGEWRVALHWLIEPADFPVWIDQIAELRQETAHFEELPVDAVVNWAASWEKSCRAHGFPRLLLRTRSVLQKKRIDDAISWASAEGLIVDKLRQLPNGMPNQRSRDSALELVRELDAIVAKRGISSKAPVPQTPRSLHRLSVESFRNIEQISLELRAKDQLVAAHVIQGPNGAGKSSIFEALALAIDSVSSRYIEFLKDPNEPKQAKPQKYLERYLTPLRPPYRAPRVGINDEDLRPIRLVDPDEAVTRYDHLSAAVSPQAGVQDLLKVDAATLGAQIAGTYSGTASAALDWTERKLNTAEAERSQFNREWGLRQDVTRSETARFRILEVVLSQVVPLSTSVIHWAENSPAGSLLRTEIRSMVSEWQGLVKRQPEHLKSASGARAKRELEAAIKVYVEQRNGVLQRISSEIQRISVGKEKLVPDLERRISLLGEWLAKPVGADAAIDSDEIIALRQQTDALATSLSTIMRRGEALRERTKHLDSLSGFLQRYWLNGYPDLCPTCGTDLQNRKGVAATIASVRDETQRELEVMRSEYQTTRSKLDALRRELASRGAPLPPITPEEHEELAECLRGLFGSEFRVDAIAGPAVRSDLLSSLKWIATTPAAPSAVTSNEQLEEQVRQLAERAWNAFVRFAEVSEAPVAWKQVQKALVDALTAAVREHLPQTVQALWWELSRNMMPAPWQYPGEIEFQVEPRREQPEARIIIRSEHRSPLAAHILNSAEIHNLELAWFLTRYLTSGRFRYSFIVLDDPAHQMDQPMFRDLCRLLKSMIRVHKRRALPLTLIVLLHQDERALDAARATDGTLHLLRWNRGTPALARSTRMRAPPILPKKPYEIVETV